MSANNAGQSGFQISPNDLYQCLLKLKSGSHSLKVRTICDFLGSPQGKHQKFQDGERLGSMEESMRLQNIIVTSMITI